MPVAYIGKVTQINSIEGADRIESLQVVCGPGGKWRGTSQKGLHKVDELVEVYLQDAILPQTERFAFMEKHHYRVKMKRFKGVPSECLIMPISVYTPLLIIREDAGQLLMLPGRIINYIKKYEKPIPAQLAGEVYGNFPSFIPKTDEPNFQTVPEMLEALKGKLCYITAKVDGCSVTYYKHEGHFGVCSRNLELKDREGNTLWRLARDCDLINELPEGFAIQCECYGEGIQGNPLGIKGQGFMCFNVWDIKNRRYLNFQEARLFCEMKEIPDVGLVYMGDFKWNTEDELRTLAEGNYGNGKPREGIVIRPMEEMQVNGERLSFKVINLEYRG